jgi:hypothetical protein
LFLLAPAGCAWTADGAILWRLIAVTSSFEPPSPRFAWPYCPSDSPTILSLRDGDGNEIVHCAARNHRFSFQSSISMGNRRPRESAIEATTRTGPLISHIGHHAVGAAGHVNS